MNHLQPGKYTFVETKAPDGYQLSKQAVAFTIAATAKDKPELVNAGTFVNETTCIQKQNQISQQRNKQLETGWLGLPKPTHKSITSLSLSASCWSVWQVGSSIRARNKQKL